jgi:hypothetical protein
MKVVIYIFLKREKSMFIKEEEVDIEEVYIEEENENEERKKK